MSAVWNTDFFKKLLYQDLKDVENLNHHLILSYLAFSKQLSFLSILFLFIYILGVCGVMIAIIGNGHSNMDSNSWQDCLHFT